jgi:hypothetical protein
MAAKKSGARKTSRAAGRTVASAMRRRKSGTLKRGPGGRGGTVKSREQAIAIGLSEAREKGEKVPAPRSSSKKSSAKKSAAKKSGAKKSGAKRAGAKKSGARKSTGKRSSSRKSSARKST